MPFFFSLGLLSIFLHANPRGCDLKSLLQYLRNYLPESLLHEAEVEQILIDNAEIFNRSKQDNNLWTFRGFSS